MSAKAIMNTEASLLAKRQKSIAVSAEQFQKAGSSNAADAAKQIVGASVVNGKDVYIRGLGDRYTSTNLKDVQMPSADPYKRSRSIDIISSNLIDNIQAVKSFTPDKPGDFSGGTVDVKTKDFSDQFNLSLSAATKYNSELSFNNNGLSYNGSSTDWLGYDDGKRAMPSAIETTPWVADIGSAQRDDVEAKRIDDVTKSFNSQMTPFKMAAPMDQSYAFLMVNQLNLACMQLGLIGSFTYKNQHSGYIHGQLNRWDRGVADPNKTQLDTNISMTDTRNFNALGKHDYESAYFNDAPNVNTIEDPILAGISRIAFSEALDPRPEVGGPAYKNLGNYITSVKRINNKSINVTDYELSQNYPNPFNPTTKIRFSIPTRSMTNLSVYNILGQKVATLVNSVKPAGIYEVDFSASSGGGLSSGIYIYILKSQNNFITKKMTLIK